MNDDELKEAKKREALERGIKPDDDDDDMEEDDEEDDSRGKKRRQDDSEEEEEDSEEESSKKKGKKRKASRLFFDEAAEDDDDEAFEDEPVEGEMVDDLTESQRRSLLLRRQQEAGFRETDATVIADRFRQKFQAQTQAGPSANMGATASVETARFIRERPGAQDPKLFMVHCKPGEEQNLVMKLYAKYIRDKHKKPEPIQKDAPRSRFALPPPPGSELEIFSIVSPGTQGIIYIEAMRQECVVAALRGVPGIFSSRISIVHQDEMTDVLRVEMRKSVIRNNDFVRVKGTFPYKGDLAQVVFKQDMGNKVTVKVVPRIDFSSLSSTERSTNNNKNQPTQKVIPPAKFFNADEVRAAGGVVTRDQHPLTSKILDVFDNHFFENGLMFLELSERQLSNINVNATTDEIAKFVSVSSKEGESNEKEILLLAEAVEQTVNKGKQSHYDFSVGDMVLVVTGPETGVQGSLESINLLGGTGQLKNAQMKIEVQLKDLVKFFKIGDHVKIIGGKHIGKSGSVVHVTFSTGSKPTTMVYTDFGEELEVFNSDMKLSAETSLGLTSLNGYALYDLVMLDQSQHGVIVRINSDTVTILPQSGGTKDIPTTAIRAKKNQESQRATVPDKNHQTLSVHDPVIVVEGIYSGTEGTIKHIYRSLLFVHSKQRKENAGIIVVKGKEVKITGGNQKGGGMSSMRGAVPKQAPRRRDEMVGKSVRIRKGNDKGLVGTVVEGGTAETLRVELNARNKIVNVPREHICILGEEMNTHSNLEPMTISYQHVPVPATPAHYTSSDAGSYKMDSRVNTSTASSFNKGDSVKLIDTGESVTVVEVADRDIIVVDTKGTYKIVNSSNLVYA